MFPRSRRAIALTLWILAAHLLAVRDAEALSALEKPLQGIAFGVANAPGQVEDQLSDIWSAWGAKGRIAGFRESPSPQDRLRFWSNPEIELDLARETGFTIFRLGADWGRIMPAPHAFDEAALDTYRTIFRKIHDRGMKVYLTLMHHSLPPWLERRGGWLHDSARTHFEEFAHRMFIEFHSEVDAWMTFNEANIFVSLAYAAGLWPPGGVRPVYAFFHLGPFRGEAVRAMDRMADAHNSLYDWAHRHYPDSRIGYAHNLAWYTGKSWLDRLSAGFISRLMNWRFPEMTRGKIDFFGFNYYGAEWIRGTRIDLDPEEEYSEAGRAVYPEGLLRLLREIHERFQVPILITENGIADRTDLLRPAYLVEHLKAVEEARKEGIPVEAYIHWTLSDNLEWADGYCPKFGLFDVDRKQNLKRTPRPAQLLLKRMIRERAIPEELRRKTWQTVLAHQGELRPFCRSEDGIHGLATPIQRQISKRDWRLHLPLTSSP
jgi:beta-glucosidase/6-phospho-beta-glucosidase/beta-galactosidase